MNQETDAAAAAKCERLTAQLDDAIGRLAQTRAFARPTAWGQVIDLARRLLACPGGASALYERAERIEAAGVFVDSDWAHPAILQPTLSVQTFRHGDTQTVVLECLSELRMLAVAQGRYFHLGISAEHARHFLSQVLALNLSLLFQPMTEAERERPGGLAPALRHLFAFIAEQIGYGSVLNQMIDEIWRILAQRPINVDDIKAMITQIAVCQYDPDIDVGGAGVGADRLISALYGPTSASREDPGLDAYAARLEGLDANTRMQEASGFARALHDTGLASPYHAVFLRHILGRYDDLLPTALGLSSTGSDALLCYQNLVHALIREAIYPETAQAIYGIALMLERGLLYMPTVGPGLWRQIKLTLCPEAEQALTLAFGSARPPRVHLLAGVLNVLGQPLGLAQGNNPICQSARALSLWSYVSPDYLLQIVAWASRDNEIVTHFEGQRLSSRDLQAGLAPHPLVDVDAVSVVVAPHIDRLYMEMGRLCADREGDPHRWVNPELHGWWVGRGCRIAVDVATGKLDDYDGFVRQFYATYHPYYNGDQPVIHPQPAGLAVTDSAARFVGWHAIAIYRVALDQEGVMRAYFYNPNNDSGQDWGQGMVVSTEGHGEFFGESSLPIDAFCSRLYLFHYDPLERGWPEGVPEADVARVTELARGSWARER